MKSGCNHLKAIVSSVSIAWPFRVSKRRGVESISVFEDISSRLTQSVRCMLDKDSQLHTTRYFGC